jgi:hypothetical protein
MEYAKTKDHLHVMKMLGPQKHPKHILYIQLVKLRKRPIPFSNSKTVQDAQKLIEAGFEYVCEFNEIKIFKKRK